MTIGDSPLSSLPFPGLFSPTALLQPHRPPSSHHTITSSSPLPSAERDKNSTSHLARGVQFKLSLMVKEYFHSASTEAVFCICLSKPRLLWPGGGVQKMVTGGGSTVLQTAKGTALRAAVEDELKAGQRVCCNLYMHPYNQ